SGLRLIFCRLYIYHGSINKLSCWADKTWGHLLDWDDKGIMHPNHLCGYTLALDDFSVPSSSLVALIDCTIQATCQPSIDQELAYMGYKKCHGFKFQTLIIPDSLISHLTEPYCAPQNDMGVYAESKLAEIMEKAIQPGSLPTHPPQQHYFQIYGDSVYSMPPMMLNPYQ
ncbi:hypothetical protein M422DRAFT_113503, partial [Sphaerobolus stellatus SS14]